MLKHQFQCFGLSWRRGEVGVHVVESTKASFVCPTSEIDLCCCNPRINQLTSRRMGLRVRKMFTAVTTGDSLLIGCVRIDRLAE